MATSKKPDFSVKPNLKIFSLWYEKSSHPPTGGLWFFKSNKPRRFGVGFELRVFRDALIYNTRKNLA